MSENQTGAASRRCSWSSGSSFFLNRRSGNRLEQRERERDRERDREREREGWGQGGGKIGSFPDRNSRSRPGCLCFRTYLALALVFSCFPACHEPRPPLVYQRMALVSYEQHPLFRIQVRSPEPPPPPPSPSPVQKR